MKKGTNIACIALPTLLTTTLYISAAIYSIGRAGWDVYTFYRMLTYVGCTLIVLSPYLFLLG